MTLYGPDDRLLVVGGYNLITDRLNVTYNRDEGFEQVDAGIETIDRYSPVSTRSATLSADGFYDDTVLQTLAALIAQGTASYPGLIGFEGNAVDKYVDLVEELFKQNVNKGASRGSISRLTGEWVGSTQIDQGQIIDPLAQYSGDGDSAADQDGGAQSTAGGRLYVFVTALDLGGGSNLGLTLEDAAVDGGPYAGQGAAVVNVTAAPFAVVRDVTGTIERYTNIARVFTGGAAQTVNMITALVRD